MAQRRLVRSPPELWAEVSCEDALGRRLAQFGEIRITRLEPETTVAWEGERASGTVELAPAGWGTKVILTAVPAGRPAAAAPIPQATAAPKPAPVAAQPQPEPEPEPAAVVPPPPRAAAPVTPPAPQERKLGFFARLFRRHPKAPEPPSARPPLATPAVVVVEATDKRTAAASPTPPSATPEPSPPALGPEPSAPQPDPAPTLPKPAAAAVRTAAAELDSERTVAILTEVLDDLGADHHRPLFSRDGLT